MRCILRRPPLALHNKKTIAGLRRAYREFQKRPSYLAKTVCLIALCRAPYDSEHSDSGGFGETPPNCQRLKATRARSCSGSGALTHTHHHLYIPIKNTLTVTCSSILPCFKSATYRTSISIGRIYVQPSTNIGVIDRTRKSPQKFFLVE